LGQKITASKEDISMASLLLAFMVKVKVKAKLLLMKEGFWFLLNLTNKVNNKE
jgi:hypothetical protein